MEKTSKNGLSQDLGIDAPEELGCQTPRIKVEPTEIIEYSDGPDAAALFEAFSGHTLDDWQYDILDGMMARRADGDFAATTAAISLSRQNGKNETILPRELHGLVIEGETILHTAHLVKTSKAAFRRLVSIFTKNEELSKMVISIQRANGNEAIYLNNGGAIEFVSRGSGTARGTTASLIVLDEAQFLTEDQLASIMSTLAAAPNGRRQMIYIGTPPTSIGSGVAFTRIRERALSKNPGRLAYYEWSVDFKSLDEIDIFDRHLWAIANPGLGRRLTYEFTLEEANNLTKEDFARERLGWWVGVLKEASVIPFDNWTDCATTAPPMDDPTSICVRFSADGARVSIAACVMSKDRPPYVEVIKTGNMTRGIRPIADWIWARLDKTEGIIIDGKAHAGTLMEMLRDYNANKKEGYKRFKALEKHEAVTTPTAAEMIMACSGLLDAVRQKDIIHYGQPGLDSAAQNSSKRKIGNDGGWGFGGDEAISIEAVALARWQAKTISTNAAAKTPTKIMIG